MANKSQNNSRLRNRAEKKLVSTGKPRRILPSNIAALIHELQVHQVELDIQNEELQKSRDRYAELYNYGPSAYLTVDCNTGKIIEMNITATDLLKITRSQAYQKRFSSFIEPESADAFHICTRKAMADPYRETVEVKMRRSDKTPFWARLDVQGEPANHQVRISVTDITEQKRAEQIKDDFIGMVSHELRTPLTVIMGSVNVARSDGISAHEVKELLEEAAQSSDTLSHILDNLIELSRYQSNRLKLAKECTDIDTLIREVVRLETNHLDHHKVWLDLSENLPEVEVDTIRVRQVVRNLLDNAAKYSPEHTEIKVTTKRENNNILIGVADRGKGISPEDQAKLFGPFERLQEKSTTRPGLGLGLLVCRRLVEAHGGTIWVESRAGHGTAFWFTLPIDHSVQTDK